MTDTTYAAGWYPDVNQSGTERYYDGTAWTAQTRTLAASSVTEVIPATATVPVIPAKKSLWKRKGFIIPVSIVGGLILVSVVTTAAQGGSSDDASAAKDKPAASAVKDEEPAVSTAEAKPVATTVPKVVGLTAKEARALIENAGLGVDYQADHGVVLDQDNWTVTGTTPGEGAALNEGDTVVVQVSKTADLKAAAEEAAKPHYSVSQQSAIDSANSYMSTIGGFSRQGLIDQLVFGKFSVEDATFAADNGGYDWNASAAQSAKSYMDTIGGFSRGSLIDQLLFVKFTQAQAEFGATSVGL